MYKSINVPMHYVSFSQSVRRDTLVVRYNLLDER
jgi:hypothetical protein